jgi:hypothetical protein
VRLPVAARCGLGLGRQSPWPAEAQHQTERPLAGWIRQGPGRPWCWSHQTPCATNYRIPHPRDGYSRHEHRPGSEDDRGNECTASPPAMVMIRREPDHRRSACASAAVSFVIHSDPGPNGVAKTPDVDCRCEYGPHRWVEFRRTVVVADRPSPVPSAPLAAYTKSRHQREPGMPSSRRFGWSPRRRRVPVAPWTPRARREATPGPLAESGVRPSPVPRREGCAAARRAVRSLMAPLCRGPTLDPRGRQRIFGRAGNRNLRPGVVITAIL